MQRFDCLAQDCAIFGPHLIEASAGTGKTFSIEHIYVRLVLESIEAEQILAVTFTRAATRELKARIRTNLEKALEFLKKKEAPWPYLLPYLGSDLAMRKLSDAIAAFDRCQVFTIHSFCSRMLREYAFEAKIGFTFPDPDQRGTPEKLKLAVQDFIRWGITEELVCLEQCSLLFKEVDSIEELKKKLLKGEKAEGVAFSELFSRYREAVKGQVVEEEKLASDFAQIRQNYKGKEDFEPEVRALARSISDPENSLHFRQLLKGGLFKCLEPSNRRVRQVPVSLNYPGFFEWAKTTLAPLLKSDVLETLQAAWNEIAEKIVAEEDYFDPDELLLQMKKAIEIESFAARVRKKYQAVVIDEFQDTDAVQWDIFSSLFFDAGIKALYFVGDPKQSIYRFRKADVYTYLQARDVLGEGHTYFLDTNYRSSKPLISALNTLFSRDWMTLPKANRVLPYQPIQAGSKADSEFGDSKGALHFFSCEEELSYVAQEIGILAAQVKNLSSIAVLVKDRYQAEQVLNALKQNGIPATARSQTPIGQTLAFQSIRELFEAVALPHDFGRAKIVAAGPFGELPLAELKHLLEEKGMVQFLRKALEVREQLVSFDLGLYRDLMQIFEWLLLWEKKEGFTFDGLRRALALLEKMDPEEGGRRRVESEPEAVQIMTLHISKGLEFDVVFALGLGAKSPDGDVEFEAEKLRLLYVAMTRAKRRLYVPLSGRKGSPMELFGQHIQGEGNLEERLARLFKAESVTFENQPVLKGGKFSKAASALPEFSVKSVSCQSSYLYSFTSLAQKKEREKLHVEEGILPRGAETGIVIHKIFERLFTEWRKAEEIVAEELAYSALAPWKGEVEKIVRETLSYPLLVDGEFFTLGELRQGDAEAEVEFIFPAQPHFVKGFIDLVFRFGGRTYFADWKTNWLEDYSQEAMAKAMAENDYYLQGAIYAEALKRHLGSETFGGIFYFFVRGNGVIHFQPDYNLIRMNHAR